jgi:formylglycine-generating enzyme required for sulfatase activity/3',5'-cyclic AMP phosphodiesterase CpdA
MSTITWLHLSDLHFRAGERHTWDEDIVLRALLDDVRARMEDGLTPDVILVSGDIAFSGTPAEYALAKQFFDDLLEVTGVPKTRLFTVPGNHDVDRQAISRGAKAIASSLDSRQAVDEVLTVAVDRRLIFRKFNRYADFVSDYFGGHLVFDDEYYFSVQPLDLADRWVTVLGLNSAWLAYGGDEDRGRLALGERQVRQALEAAKEADLRIALLHHPFDWFQEFDRNDCEALLMQGCEFVLHGHLHRTGLLSLTMPDAGAMIIAAGASYASRDYPNSYNFVQLDLGTGQGTVYLRRYSDERGGFWTKDVMTYQNVDDGQCPFELTPSLGTAPTADRREMPSVSVMPAVDPAQLEASYLRRMQDSCTALPLAVIDPRAFERTRQQTMDLLAVYVALHTQTQVAIEKESEDKGKHLGPERAMESDREIRRATALEVADHDRKTVLLGDPGGGKSTFANYLALCLAGARLEHLGETSLLGDGWLAHLEPTWTHGPLLPLLITLRHFAGSDRCDGTAAGLWNFVADTLATQGLADFAPYLRQQFLDGGVMALLDGLDEVADPEEREAVRDAVADFTATYGNPANRYLVTCRGYAYQDTRWQLERFAVHTLAPFTQEQIDEFIGCWYKEVCRLGWKSEIEAEDLTHRLQAATRRPDLAPLARNPLQLMMMASLHFSWGRLPEDRVELYQEMVRLLLVRWQEARLGEDMGVTQAVSAGKLESALERVAFVAHRAQEGPEGTADVSEVALRSVLKDYLEGSWDRAGDLVTYIQERAGLLIERGPGLYTFPHRSYQEYLAGSYLAVQPDFPDQAATLIGENYAQWREVVLWAVAVMARLKMMVHVAVDVAAALCPREVAERAVSEADWQAAHLAGEALLEIGLEEVEAHERHEQVLARVQRWLVALIERGVLTPVERAAAADVLARLGDPRPGVGLRSDGLPDILWCEVPAGSFIMGSKDDPDAWEDESPQHEQSMPYGYRISKYPVTNAQYAAFVQHGGYVNPGYWTEAGWQDKGDRTRPETYGGVYDLPNHPVVMVSWYEALAFCRWLDEQLHQRGELSEGEHLTLPTEAEWEKAARGTDGRRYSWSAEPDPNRANYDETGIGTTSAVGIFPGGETPYGCLDMSGNVLEWCRTKWLFNYAGYEEQADHDPEGTSGRVLRGGAFYGSRRNVRCANRGGNLPDYRDWYDGFRVVVSPHHSPLWALKALASDPLGGV